MSFKDRRETAETAEDMKKPLKARIFLPSVGFVDLTGFAKWEGGGAISSLVPVP